MIYRGQYELADKEKVRLEESQRQRRYERQDAGHEWKPLWFTKAVDEHTGEEFFKYKGGYWESREKGFQGLNIINIFEEEKSGETSPVKSTSSLNNN